MKKIDAKQIFHMLGMSRKEIAETLGTKTSTIYQMTANNHIPNHHWGKIIELSSGRVTWDMLEGLGGKDD